MIRCIETRDGVQAWNGMVSRIVWRFPNGGIRAWMFVSNGASFAFGPPGFLYRPDRIGD